MTNHDNILLNYNYEIPESLIAQKPVENRQDSKLFVIDRASEKFYHRRFSDIIEYFNSGDCLIINTTKVVPSRLFGKKISGGKVELLFLDPCQQSEEYKVLLKPFIAIGKKIYFDDGYECEILSKTELGETLVKFNKSGVLEFLQDYGIMPLPPYINRKGNLAQELSDFDKQRYQTIYAKNFGAIAAPTAGLHFTDDILTCLKEKGINIATLTLHVGWGTFRPITAMELNNHNMLPEKFTLDKTNAEIINSAIKTNKKIIAVGTTSVRAIETIAKKVGFLENDKTYMQGCSGETSIFIYPGYKFKIINTLITNLHLPKSTPLMMTSAFSSRKLMLRAYKEAVQKKYRFFSYGDSMLIL
ncbi:MAG: tRNA preQ1(34) S-adenosylmethionine ribosyltransferase-isomerase QueA [Endomicrobium sp.]|uniref:tRNA preQ1(34) S-adenosylmethionine ribosyltransferase-isomerase QueA n=1 Tax=Candidatus Endomicrobiellum pyrsonymphae TaxID=1408203 RepID=UPI00357D6DAF|nr:tRNA preQ1(34) S-adenosylmethionine ribosyltransferase-isomerase QueA [Endomicrobium sp.]